MTGGNYSLFRGAIIFFRGEIIIFLFRGEFIFYFFGKLCFSFLFRVKTLFRGDFFGLGWDFFYFRVVIFHLGVNYFYLG